MSKLFPFYRSRMYSGSEAKLMFQLGQDACPIIRLLQLFDFLDDELNGRREIKILA